MLSLVLAILVTAAAQTPAVDRRHAEISPAAGRTAEAINLFERIVKSNPADIEAQLWLARLFLRAGRTAEAEAAFRAVSLAHPNDVDARIGLAMALTRRGLWEEALVILREVEPVAGENANAFGALARAYRRGGDDQQALEYFQRARGLSPNDADLVMGYEAVVRAHGHWISFEGVAQDGGPGTRVTSGAIAVNARIFRQLHLEAMGRVQEGPDYSDAIGGGGFTWRLAGPTTITFHAEAVPTTSPSRGPTSRSM